MSIPTLGNHALGNFTLRDLILNNSYMGNLMVGNLSHYGHLVILPWVNVVRHLGIKPWEIILSNFILVILLWVMGNHTE